MLHFLKYSLVFTLFISNLVSAYPADDNDESQEVSESRSNAVYDNYRLPTSIKPENYKLEIFTHLNDSEGFLFRGVAAITVSEIHYISTHYYAMRLHLDLL